jgi:hypothetical protein
VDPEDSKKGDLHFLCSKRFNPSKSTAATKAEKEEKPAKILILKKGFH